MNKAELKQKLTTDIACMALEIEDTASRYGLHLGHVTIIARNPKEPGMYIVVTNEDPQGVKDAAELVLQHHTEGDKIQAVASLIEIA